MTDYGKIDVLWFDFSYDSMTAEKWEAEKLVKMIRQFQPDVILDNRLIKDEDWVNNADRAEPYSGDFFSPEQYVPSSVFVDELQRPFPWELCLTTQAVSWGYSAEVESFMCARDVIRVLVDCVSKNGNLLLNVGPNGKGKFPEPVVRLFEEVGEWMRENGESIYGCGPATLPRPDWGRYTMRDNCLYVHFFDKLGYHFHLTELKTDAVDFAMRLSDHAEVKLNGSSRHMLKKTGDVNIVLSSARLPDSNDTVIKLILNRKLAPHLSMEM